jgi:hypothetical protein
MIFLSALCRYRSVRFRTSVGPFAIAIDSGSIALFTSDTIAVEDVRWS